MLLACQRSKTRLNCRICLAVLSWLLLLCCGCAAAAVAVAVACAAAAHAAPAALHKLLCNPFNLLHTFRRKLK